MTKTQTDSITVADPTVATAAAQFLTPLVHGLEALVVNGKQAHWNVRGANFIAVHELIDEIVGRVQEFADDAAERVVALGLPLDSRLNTVAEKVSQTSVPAGFTQSDEMIGALVSDIDTVLIDVKAAVEGLDEVDLTSQDVAIEIQRGLEKDRWFLISHLAA